MTIGGALTHEIKAGGNAVKDLTEYSEKKQIEILKKDFGVKQDKSDLLYMSLLDYGAVNREKAIWIRNNREKKKGLKFKHLAETGDKKIYLTSIGETIAKGAKKLFVKLKKKQLQGKVK